MQDVVLEHQSHASFGFDRYTPLVTNFRKNVVPRICWWRRRLRRGQQTRLAALVPVVQIQKMVNRGRVRLFDRRVLVPSTVSGCGATDAPSGYLTNRKVGVTPTNRLLL